jgi:CDP-diacylglycerol--serine O-phosphatidyltransferase
LTEVTDALGTLANQPKKRYPIKIHPPLCLYALELGDVKRIAILPTLLTLGNGVCGFAAIAYASKIAPVNPISQSDCHYFFYAGWLILAAMVFDSLDGFVARLSRTSSDFGGQLDSLCDAVSFGAAPAFLLLRLGQDWQAPSVRNIIPVIAALYVVCAILRLARFNVENSPDPGAHKRFKGLPSPAAAGCLATLAMLRGQTPNVLSEYKELLDGFVRFGAPLGTLVVALLMVSRVGYPHMTKQLLRGRRHFSYVVRIVFVLFLIMLIQELGLQHVALIIGFWGYALYFFGRHLALRATGKRRLTSPSSPDEPTAE